MGRETTTQSINSDAAVAAAAVYVCCVILQPAVCVCIYLTVGASEADVGNQEEGLAACDGS